MASLKRRDDGVWRARYRDDAGREHARHFPRKVDAQRWLDEATAALVTGQYVRPKAGRVTLGEWASPWLAGRAHLKPKSLASYESLLKARKRGQGVHDGSRR